MFSLSARGCPAPAAEFHSGASKTRVLRCLDTWTLKNVVFSRVLGVMAPMARLVMCLGRLGHQNRPKRVPKGSLLMSLVDTFPITKQHPERDGSQVAFSLFFCGFLEGPTLDPLAPAQSKHSLPFSAWPLKGSRFYCSSFCIFCTFGVENSLKGHFKIEFEKQKLQQCFIFAFLLFWAPFWTPYGTSFLASGAWVPSKRQGFLEPGALELQKVVSHLVWGHWRFRNIVFS